MARSRSSFRIRSFMFPTTLASYHIPGMATLQTVLQRGDWLFNFFYVLLIVFFCYFYTAVTFQAVARDKLIAIRTQLVDQPAADQHAKFQA